MSTSCNRACFSFFEFNAFPFGTVIAPNIVEFVVVIILTTENVEAGSVSDPRVSSTNDGVTIRFAAATGNDNTINRFFAELCNLVVSGSFDESTKHENVSVILNSLSVIVSSHSRFHTRLLYVTKQINTRYSGINFNREKR
jgi:hypothetical protein